MQFSQEAVALLQCAAGKARDLGHSCVGSEHILLALLNDPGICSHLLRAAGSRANTVAMSSDNREGIGFLLAERIKRRLLAGDDVKPWFHSA